MNDRSAAIKALERAWNYLDVQNRTFKAVVLKCNGVYDGVTVFNETLDGIKDAIALLKAQEPVEPLEMEVEHVRKEPVVFMYKCPVCLAGLQRHWVACPICGMAVKWE